MAALAFLAFVAFGIPFALAQTNSTLPDTSIPATCLAGQQEWVGNNRGSIEGRLMESRYSTRWEKALAILLQNSRGSALENVSVSAT